MKKIITDSFSGGLITSCSEIKILGWSGPLRPRFWVRYRFFLNSESFFIFVPSCVEFIREFNDVFIFYLLYFKNLKKVHFLNTG